MTKFEENYVNKIKIDKDNKIEAIDKTTSIYSIRYQMFLYMKSLSDLEGSKGNCFKWGSEEIYNFIIDNTTYSDDATVLKNVLINYFAITNHKFPDIIKVIDFNSATPKVVKDMIWTRENIIKINIGVFDTGYGKVDMYEKYYTFILYALLYYYGVKESNGIPETSFQEVNNNIFFLADGIVIPVNESIKEILTRGIAIIKEKNYTYKNFRDYWSERRSYYSSYKSFSVYSIKWAGIYRRMLKYDLENANIISNALISRKKLANLGHPIIKNGYEYTKAVRRYKQWRKEFNL